MHYCFAGYVLDTDSYVLSRDGAAVPVEPQVFDLLALLAANAGKLVTRDRIVDEIWDGRAVSEATISARINAARKAVGDSGKSQAVIRTIPRRGLEMVAKVREDPDVAPAAPAAAETRQTIRYTTSADGTGIAYAVSGEGPPLLCASHHVTHLELEWVSPLWRPTFDKLGAHHTLVRYDMRGAGLSDPGPEGATIERHIEDMLAVANAAGLDKLDIWATLNGAAPALRLAADEPGRVGRLVLQEGYARGRLMRGDAPADPASDPFVQLMRSGGWGDPGNGFLRGWVSMAMPNASYEDASQIIRQFGAAGKLDHMIANRATIDHYDVRDWLARVRAPTLVIHARNGILHPLEEGRILAAGIPGAEFLVVETGNSLCIRPDPTWAQQTDAMLEFLANG